jgi:ABC-type sugar transport system permease subunit
MRLLKMYWLEMLMEMLMVLPLFAYLSGFTLLPILTNLKESFIDQRFGRRYDMRYSYFFDPANGKTVSL